MPPESKEAAKDSGVRPLEVQRGALLKCLQECFASGSVTGQVGLVLLDIREFRELNRSFGEQCGNSVLAEITQRLNALPSPGFQSFYLGADEFAVVLTTLRSPGFAVLGVEQIIDQFKRVFEWQQHTLKITVNCGLAYNFDAHHDPNKLLYDAETALVRATAQNQPYQLLGKNEQAEVDQLKWQLLNDLHEAMRDDKLSLYYQPKIRLGALDAADENCYSAEALIRWETEEHGIISPDTTLPLIEHLGSEVDLIRWLLNTALKKISAMQSTATPVGLSINVPPASVTTRELHAIIREALSLWQVPAKLLTLEITEDVLIRDKEEAFNHLSKLRALGVRIAIDDFGTGYSSLAYFKHLPADELKIDRAFIEGLLDDKASYSIVKLVIELAHSLGLCVVAEGVEDQRTLDKLKAMHCDYAQGFFIAKPMPEQPFTDWLAKQNSTSK
ncbi:MAG: EAL domain-containing protein [Gammaproteobacteria bacterium]|nr:EAL domain-containing protein [Gammaproteobacteria bacterium]